MGKDCTTKLKWNIITQILSLIITIICYFWEKDKWWFKALYIGQLILVTIANIVLLTCCKKKKNSNKKIDKSNVKEEGKNFLQSIDYEIIIMTDLGKLKDEDNEAGPLLHSIKQKNLERQQLFNS